MEGHLGNYVRTHRKKAGLSQRELGVILGYDTAGPVSRHERSQSIPPLLIALGYQELFRIPLGEIFAGLHEAEEANVERRIVEFENSLQQQSARGRRATLIAHKLEWLGERRTLGSKQGLS